MREVHQVHPDLRVKLALEDLQAALDQLVLRERGENLAQLVSLGL